MQSSISRGEKTMRSRYNNYSEKPSTVVQLCSAANFINAADRVLMPICIVQLAKEHAYTLHNQAYILSAFPLGYISSQIIGSCAGAQIGGKRLLLFVVFMWSLSTVLTPLVASYHYLLLLTRVVLGLGEGLGLPTIYHLYADCVPANRRSTAFAYLTAAGGVGQAIAAVFTPHLPWRIAFYAFGALGFVWCLLWLKKWSNIESKATSKQPPPLLYKQTCSPLRQWRVFLLRSPLLAIYVAHFAMNWSSYMIMHWLPTYLHTVLDANPTDISLAALPYIANSVAAVVVGNAADYYVNNGRMTQLTVRRLSTFLGLMLPAFFLLAFAYVTHLYSAIMLITLSMAVLALNASGHLSNHVDVCPRHAGISFAISNTIATLPGLLVGPLTAALVMESRGRWWPAFVLAAMIDACAACVYANYARITPVL